MRRISLRLPLWVPVGWNALSSQALDALLEDIDRREAYEYVDRKRFRRVDFHLDRLGQVESTIDERPSADGGDDLYDFLGVVLHAG